MKLPRIDEISLRGKKVFLRGDIDVPLKQSVGGDRQKKVEIADDSRLEAIFKTVEYLLAEDCSIVLAGHLDRPGGVEKSELSSRPVAEWFRNRMASGQSGANPSAPLGVNSQVSGVCLKGDICGFVVTDKLTVLENLRFGPKEEANDLSYGRDLAGLAEVYVNESFAESYRAVASVVGVPKFLPHYGGFRLVQEVSVLESVLFAPRRPLLVIVGGAKLDTKAPVINKMIGHADNVIVGGKLLAEITARNRLVNYLDLTVDQKDTTLNSIDKVSDVVLAAATIVWNGPLGMVEDISYQLGTRHLAELVTSNTSAYKVVGGGDTIGFIEKLGLIKKFNWVSTGGGAMLKFLSGEELPGITALLT